MLPVVVLSSFMKLTNAFEMVPTFQIRIQDSGWKCENETHSVWLGWNLPEELSTTMSGGL
jgi:hypothetical protein